MSIFKTREHEEDRTCNSLDEAGAEAELRHIEMRKIGETCEQKASASLTGEFGSWAADLMAKLSGRAYGSDDGPGAS
jgi:hypothetical protein